MQPSLAESKHKIFLGEIVSFLHQYAWIFDFPWITSIVCDTDDSGLFQSIIHPILTDIPNNWKQCLLGASFDDLKCLVRGNGKEENWIPELIEFRKRSAEYTHHLQCSIAWDGPRLWSETTASNRCIRSVQLSPCLPTMSKKKEHEVRRMVDLVLSIINQPSSSFSSETDIDYKIPSSGSSTQNGQLEALGPALIVDIGSGVGHFPNCISYNHSEIHRSISSRLSPAAQPLCSKSGTSKALPIHILAIESDPKLHATAIDILSRYERLRVDANGTSTELPTSIHRWLLHVEDNSLPVLKQRLRKFINLLDVDLPDTVSRSLGYTERGYLITGLHCCGDLSQSILHLFHCDRNARVLLLVGCCYHKMTLDTFPTSEFLRSIVATHSSRFAVRFQTKPTFRLACQWSPLRWLQWTTADFNTHRTRFVFRMLLNCFPELSSTYSRQKLRSDPTSCGYIKCVLADPELSFTHLLPLLRRFIKDQYNISVLDSATLVQLEQLWLLTPGMLALQQIMQPLLESIILADRLWSLREKNILSNSGFVQLFDPVLSPRCMVLLACK